MNLKDEKQLMKKFQGLFFLQLMSLIFIFYGLFFFYKDIENTQSPEINPVMEVKATNSSHKISQDEQDDGQWFNKQYERVFLFFDKSSQHEPDFYQQLNFTCDDSEGFKNYECEREIEINVEPLCFEEQKIEAIMTGNYPFILDHIYNHHDLSHKDSLINQMKRKNIKSALFGNSEKWSEIFPDYFNSNNTYSSEKIVDIIEHTDFNQIKFGIGEYIDKQNLLEDFQDLIDNLGHTKRALLLIYEEHDCSVFQDRKNNLIAYSTLGFQQYLTQQEIGEPFPKQIDFASTLSVLLGLPLPFDNFGSPIVDVYAQSLKHKVTFKNHRFSYLHSIAYHYMMTFDSTVEYLTELNSKYSFYFIQKRVNVLTDLQQDIYESLQKLEDKFYNYDDTYTQAYLDFDGEYQQEFEQISDEQKEQFYNLKIEIIDLIRFTHTKIQKTRLIIEHNNFGPIYILVFGFLGFFFTFFVFTLLMTAYQSIFGFIRNTMSFMFQFSKIFSMDFFNFVISTIATFLFVVGGVYSRLQFQVEGNIIMDAMLVFCVFQVLISLCDSEIQEKRKIASISMILLTTGVFQLFRYLDDDYNQFYINLTIVGGIAIGILFFIIILKIEEQQQSQQQANYHQILLVINIVLSIFFYQKEDTYLYVKYAVIALFFFNISFYIKMLRNGKIDRISNIANILLIFMTLAPLLAIISHRSQIYIKFLVFLIGSITYLRFQIIKKEQRSYQSIIFLMLFMTVFQDSILHTRELHSLDFEVPKQSTLYIIIQCFMNIFQISLAQICTAFLIPIWVKIINLNTLDLKGILNTKEEKFLKFSRFGSIFIICTLYTLRICIYIITIIARNFKSDTKYAQYRILKEGFIFEIISYLVFFWFLIFVCNFSRYLQKSYRNIETHNYKPRGLVANANHDYNNDEEDEEEEEKNNSSNEITTEMGHLNNNSKRNFNIDEL